MIRIQSDIVNTRKGQDGDGRGIRRTQPRWEWHLVLSYFRCHTVRGQGCGLGGGLGVGCPNPGTGSHGSVAFAEGGEMPFSQQSFSLTLV